MSRKISGFLPLFAMCLSGPALAQDVPNASLSQIKSETLLLKAKADEAAALKTVNSYLDTPAPSVPEHTVENDPAPNAIGLFGPPSAPYAKVEMPDGRKYDAPAGTVLPGGKWRVEIKNGSIQIVPIHRGP